METLNRYFDNGATSFPKPKEVGLDISEYLNNIGGTYGRSAYERVIETTYLVESCRDKMLEIFGAASGSVVFSNNATSAINLLVTGLKIDGKKVLISPLEHNAVMRTLIGHSISYDVMPFDNDGRVDLNQLSKIDMTQYSMIIVNHQSNVNGVIQPIEGISQLKGSVPILVDTAQSLGEIDFRADDWDIDYAVFTGHKSLLGPTGVGGYYAKDISKVSPVIFGGTGSNSMSFDMPTTFPDRYESGTPNIVSIIGLLSALKNAPSSLHTRDDFKCLLLRLKKLDGIKLICSNEFNNQGELFSIIPNVYSTADFAFELQEKYEIETRVGVQCSPISHKNLGTQDTGTIRISLSKYHTKEDLDYLYSSIRAVADNQNRNIK